MDQDLDEVATATLTSRPAWRTLRKQSIRDAAFRVSVDLAQRLREPSRVEGAVVEARLGSSSTDGGPPWAAAGLAQGYAGLALLFGHLDRCLPGEGWDELAHEHLEIAAHGAAVRAHPMPGLFSGLSGVAFSASYLSHGGTRYRRLLSTLDRAIGQQLKPLTTLLSSQRSGVGVNAFDVVAGLSGIGAYLLTRLESGIPAGLDDLLRCLVELSKVDDGMPRWHSPAHLSSPSDFMLKTFPNGYLNCGLAHGIPGPLATLSLAKLAGLSCPGMDEAIDRLATWLVTHRRDDSWGINWPTGVGLLSGGSPRGQIAPVAESPHAQAGWCYGSPGVARSLYLAGLALGIRSHLNLAFEAMHAILNRPASARKINSPTFCHGVAGLLQIMLRFANDTQAESLFAGAEQLTGQLLTLYEPDTLLGYRSVEVGGIRVDQPGLLDGTPGVALVLLAASRPVNPEWDRIFLLS